MVLLLISDLLKKGEKNNFFYRLKRVIILGSTAIPAGLYMLVLYRIVFKEDSSNSISIRFGFFLQQNYLIILMVLTSMALPIIVLCFNFKKLKQEVPYKVAWAMFFVGLSEFLIFVEAGTRMQNGNFGWGRMFSGYFLFFMSAVVLIENYKDVNFLIQYPNLRKGYLLFAALVGMLHIVSQLVYFLGILKGNNYFC